MSTIKKAIVLLCALAFLAAGCTNPSGPTPSPTLINLQPTTPVPVPPRSTLSTSQLPIGYPISPDYLDYFNTITRPDDLVGAGLANLDTLDQIKVGRKVLIFGLAARVQDAPEEDFAKVEIIGLDLEPGDTPADQVDVIGIVKQAAEIARQHNVKLLVAPTAKWAEEYGAQIALYADIIIVQMMRYQADPAEFAAQTHTMSTAMRAANPQVSVFVQVGTQRDQNPAELVAAVQAALPDIDGVWIQWHYRPEDAGLKTGGPNIQEVQDLVVGLRGSAP